MFRKLRQKKFVKMFGIKLAGNLTAITLSVVSSILTARLLGPENKGFHTLLYSTINLSIAAIALKVGLSQTYLRKNYSFNELTSNTIFISLINGILTALIASVVVKFFYTDVFQGVPQNLLNIVFLTIPLMLFTGGMSAMLIADYDIPGATVVQVSRPAIFLLAFSIAAVFGAGTLDSSVKSILISVLGMTVVSIFMVFRRGFSAFTLNTQALREMIAFELKTHLGGVFKYFQYRFDIFLVAYFLTPTDVGIYSIAMVLAEILWRIPNVASTVLLPRLTKEGNRRSAELSARLNRIIFAFTAACTVPLFLCVDWLISLLYGDDYIAAGPVVIVLLPGILALSVWKLLTPNLIMLGRAWTYSFSVGCSVFVMLTLDVFMIPKYGIIGAGIAASLAYITASVIVLFVVLRLNDLPFRDYFNVLPELKILISNLRSKR